MMFFSGVCTGSLGLLLLSGIVAVFYFRHDEATDDARTALIHDLSELLGAHLPPLIAAIDRHGVTLQRHARNLSINTDILAHAIPASTATTPAAPSTPAPAPDPSTIPATTTPATS